MTPCPKKRKESSSKYKDVQEKENKSKLMLAKDQMTMKQAQLQEHE
jgi:hypothetical protein